MYNFKSSRAFKKNHFAVVSSTPTHPYQSKKKWINQSPITISPINAQISTSNNNSFNHVSCQLLASGDLKNLKPEKNSLGLSDLVANLNNLGIDITCESKEIKRDELINKEDSAFTSKTDIKNKSPDIARGQIKNGGLKSKNVFDYSWLVKPISDELNVLSKENTDPNCEINRSEIKDKDQKNNSSMLTRENLLQPVCDSYSIINKPGHNTSLAYPVIGNNDCETNTEQKSSFLELQNENPNQLLNSVENIVPFHVSPNQQESVDHLEHEHNVSKLDFCSKNIKMSNVKGVRNKYSLIGNKTKNKCHDDSIHNLLKRSEKIRTAQNNTLQEPHLQKNQKREEPQIFSMSNETFKNPNSLQIKSGKGWRRSFYQQKKLKETNCRRASLAPILMKIMNEENRTRCLENSDGQYKCSINTTCENSSYFPIDTSLFSQRVCTRKPNRGVSNVVNHKNQNMHDIAEESCSLSKKNASSHDNSRCSMNFDQYEVEQSSYTDGKPSVHSLNITRVIPNQEVSVVREELNQSRFAHSPSKGLVEPKVTDSSATCLKVELSNNKISVVCPNSEDESDSSDLELKIDKKTSSEDVYFTTPPCHRTNLQNASSEETPIILRKMESGAFSTITKRKKKLFSPLQKIVPCQNFSSGSTESSYHSVVENIDELSIRQRDVLNCCGIQGPIPFLEAFSSDILESGKKIGEGVFGEVFMLERSKTEKTVVKIIPVEGTQLVNGEPQKHFYEVLSELIISRELSLLRENKEEATAGFCELKNQFCVQGRYPSILLEHWHKFDKEKESVNDSPEMFGEEQMYMALELSHAGEAVESFKFTHAQQTFSVFLQTTYSLAVAEACLDFEHRDLHVGNILVKATTDVYSDFIRDGTPFSIPIYGVKATIIDFTLSRITYKDDVLFFDMANDPELFTAEGDYQFDIYRHMKQDVNNNWNQYQPITNLRWLDYLIDKFLTKIKYTNYRCKLHQQYKKKLETLKDFLFDFKSCSELADYLQETYCETSKLIEFK